MRPIYKSVVLESAILAVSLSLQAEINDGSDITTVGVDASTLDGLRVELASPKVSGALDLIASGAAVVSGSTISVTLGGFEELATLEQVTYRLTVKARYGTQVRTLYALDITVPRGTLAGGTQEYEDSFAVVSTFGDGGGEFPDDYARQGDNPNATNTAIYEAMQGLTGLEPDVAAGKIALAAAITAKGVQSSSDETLQQMAVDVQQITQSPVVVEGGEMYAKQLYGSLTTPNYWNLYEVMANLLSDGRLVSYGGILLAEYYRGYDSLALSGAGSGGAYVVSDMENGAFKMYTEDTTHTWSTEFDGKANRWVAYCFAGEAHSFEITNTGTSPRAIHIGRHVGAITSLVAGRCSEIVVTDGNKLDSFQSSYAQNFGKSVIIRNLQTMQSGVMFPELGNSDSVYVEVEQPASDAIMLNMISATKGIRNIIVKSRHPNGFAIFQTNSAQTLQLSSLIITGADDGYIRIPLNTAGTMVVASPISVCITDCLSLAIDCSNASSTIGKVYIDKGRGGTNEAITFTAENSVNNGWSGVSDAYLENGFCKQLNISWFASLTEANMYAHILQRLKQDEADCGDGVTITLGATNLAKLTSQESVDLLDALTNTYGYTFA